MSRGPGSTRRRSSLSVQDLSSELVSVAVEWQDLGLRLGLQPWRLRQVEHDYSSCRDRLMACLDAWVRSKEDASWGDVVAALKEMEEHALAMKVEDVHCGMAIHLPGLSSPSPMSSSSPWGDEHELTAVAAEENYTMMMGRFAQLQVLVCSRIQQQLQANAISLDELVLYVKTLFSPGDCIPHSINVADIFIAITRNHLWDFLHYHRLAKIATMFVSGDVEVKSRLRQYAEDLTGYKVATKMVDYINIVNEPTNIGEPEEIEEPSLSPPPARKDNSYLRNLTIKLKITITKQSLSYIDELWDSLSALFLIPPSTAILDKILTGSLYISWLIPSHCVPQVMEGVQRSKTVTFFLQREIEFIALGGIKIYREAKVLQMEQQLESVFVECEKCSKRILKKNAEHHRGECQGSANESASVIPRLTWLENFNSLYNLLQPISTRWFGLARELKVRIQPQTDPFTNVLRQWLSRKQAPSRKELAQALENMGEVDLAIRVRSQLFRDVYPPPPTTSTSDMAASSSSISATSPHKAEHFESRDQLGNHYSVNPSGVPSQQPSSASQLSTPSLRQHGLTPNHRSVIAPPPNSSSADPSHQSIPSLSLLGSRNSAATATSPPPMWSRGSLRPSHALLSVTTVANTVNHSSRSASFSTASQYSRPQTASVPLTASSQGHFSPGHALPVQKPTSPSRHQPAPPLSPHKYGEGMVRRATSPPSMWKRDTISSNARQLSYSSGGATALDGGFTTSAGDVRYGATAMSAGIDNAHAMDEDMLMIGRSVSQPPGHPISPTHRQATRL